MHAQWLPLIATLLVTGAVVFLLTACFMAQVLLRPARMTDGKAVWVLKRLSPGDLGLAFEQWRLEVRDERSAQRLNIAAWWIPHPQARGRCVILLHGYADAKVGSIAWAPLFHGLGWHVLAIDLRAHGESDGIYCTAGYFERHDVSQLIDRLRAERPDDLKTIVLFGASMGAAVAAAVGAMDPSQIAGVILECPYPDYRIAAASHARYLGAPGGILESLAYHWAQQFSGADFTAVRPVATIPQIRCPLMVIQSGSDVVLSQADHTAIETAAHSRAEFSGPLSLWQVERAHHLTAIYDDPVEYHRRIAAFLATVEQWQLHSHAIAVDSAKDD